MHTAQFRNQKVQNKRMILLNFKNKLKHQYVWLQELDQGPENPIYQDGFRTWSQSFSAHEIHFTTALVVLLSNPENRFI